MPLSNHVCLFQRICTELEKQETLEPSGFFHDRNTLEGHLVLILPLKGRTVGTRDEAHASTWRALTLIPSTTKIMIKLGQNFNYIVAKQRQYKNVKVCLNMQLRIRKLMVSNAFFTPFKFVFFQLCFCCRTRRFSFFTWSYTCQFCKR